MDSATIINPALSQSAQTLINPQILEESGRSDHHHNRHEMIFSEGDVLLDKYLITRQLEVASAEADLYLCTFNGSEYAAKIYKRPLAVKKEVAQALLQIDSPYVARLYEIGDCSGFPVEIFPYYENGSLQGKILTEEELIQRIIPDINEGLHALHKAGIIHKDLKPSNIMLNSDRKSVSIIDFGISSAVEGDNTILVTKTGMTPEYSAPETFKNIYYKGSDYYSFGIALFELLCGYTPYANMQPDEIEQYISIQRIPFPETMSAKMQDFISALTYSDISFRSSKNNPNRRWTYEEVCRWLNGEPQIIPGEGIGNGQKGTMPAYEFLGHSYTDPVQLVTAFAKNWEEGKKHLFRGYITSHFRTCNHEIARKCQAAEDEAARENGRDDIIFWKLLYQIDPQLKGFYWKGKTFESLPAFGRDILEKLWDKDHSQFPYYAGILSEKLLTQYVLMFQPKNENLKKAAAAIENSYRLETMSGTDFSRTCYLMAYTLSGQKLLLLDGKQFRTVGELAQYIRSVLDESYDRFTALCHRLIDYRGELSVELETWLIAIGKQNEIDQWRAAMNE